MSHNESVTFVIRSVELDPHPCFRFLVVFTRPLKDFLIYGYALTPSVAKQHRTVTAPTSSQDASASGSSSNASGFAHHTTVFTHNTSDLTHNAAAAEDASGGSAQSQMQTGSDVTAHAQDDEASPEDAEFPFERFL